MRIHRIYNIKAEDKIGKNIYSDEVIRLYFRTGPMITVQEDFESFLVGYMQEQFEKRIRPNT